MNGAKFVAKRLRAMALSAPLFTLYACAQQPEDTDRLYAPGFVSGVWHGLVAWIALIAHFFDNSIAVYAFPNSGGWYDFGFLIGAFFSGGMTLFLVILMSNYDR